MQLNVAASSMLYAIFGMGLLTLIMAVWTTVARSIAMRRGQVEVQEAAHTRDLGASTSLGPAGGRQLQSFA
jgi:hypothetical protein